MWFGGKKRSSATTRTVITSPDVNCVSPGVKLREKSAAVLPACVIRGVARVGALGLLTPMCITIVAEFTPAPKSTTCVVMGATSLTPTAPGAGFCWVRIGGAGSDETRTRKSVLDQAPRRG